MTDNLLPGAIEYHPETGSVSIHVAVDDHEFTLRDGAVTETTSFGPVAFPTHQPEAELWPRSLPTCPKGTHAPERPVSGPIRHSKTTRPRGACFPNGSCPRRS